MRKPMSLGRWMVLSQLVLCTVLGGVLVGYGHYLVAAFYLPLIVLNAYLLSADRKGVANGGSVRAREDT